MKTKSEAISAWQPTDAKDPSGFVMPYTQGGPSGSASQAASLQGSSTIDGFMGAVGGNTDNGVSHDSASVNLGSASGLKN